MSVQNRCASKPERYLQRATHVLKNLGTINGRSMNENSWRWKPEITSTRNNSTIKPKSDMDVLMKRWKAVVSKTQEITVGETQILVLFFFSFGRERNWATASCVGPFNRAILWLKSKWRIFSPTPSRGSEFEFL